MNVPAWTPDYDPEWSGESVPAPSITVHALRENKRPIGFAPWPKEPKPKKKRKRKKAA